MAKISKNYKPTQKEKFMNAKMKEYFKQKLLSWKNELLKESSQTLNNLQSDNEAKPDITDRASEEIDRSFELRTRDRERKLINKINSALQRIEDGSYGYCEETGEPIGLKRLEDKDFKFYANIASSAQVVLEEITTKLFKYIHKESDIKNFLFSGGVSLNSKLVSKLSKLNFIDSLEIPSSPGDSGASIGAAYFLSRKKTIQKNNNLYTGIVNHNRDFIEQKFIKIYNEEDIIEGSVDLLNRQNIICTCIGNIETGPRALGNRSFLCDARNELLVKELNIKVKRRSSFIPTAPV